MVNMGDVIDNPVTGERITFTRTSAQTGGELAEIEWELKAGTALTPEHLHLHQDKKFEILDGRLRLSCNGEQSVNGPGEVVVVPAGTPHTWATNSDEGARVRLTFTPGAAIEDFLDEYFRHGREGRINAKGMLSLPVTARLGLEHDVYLAGPPVPVQRVAFRVLAALGRLVPRR